MFKAGPRKPRGGNNWQPRHPDSRELTPDFPVGEYVYVVDEAERVFACPDGDHRHPEVLGRGKLALYAGEIVLVGDGRIVELNNLSGTFKFTDMEGLRCLADHLVALGFRLEVDSVRRYDRNGFARVISTGDAS